MRTGTLLLIGFVGAAFALMGCGDDTPVEPATVTLVGQVVGADGAPLPGAEIAYAFAPAEGVESVLDWQGGGRTDDDGRYSVVIELPQADARPLLHVQAAARDHPFQVPASVTVWADAGAASIDVPRMALLGGGGLRGRLVDSAEIGVPGQAIRLDHPGWPEPFLATSGPDGGFVFPSVPEGEVVVRRREGDAEGLRAVVVAGGEVMLQEDLLLPDA